MTARSSSPSPPPKRVKLDVSIQQEITTLEHDSLADNDQAQEHSVTDNADKDLEEEYEQFSICLQPIIDRTVVPTCSHEFCFECLLVWTGTSTF